MDWKDVGKTISKVAPILGTILGGPVGAAAGGAASLIASLFGCEEDPAAVMQAIQNDPQAMIRLKELEVQHRADILKWKTAQIEAEIADRVGARQASVDGGDRTRLYWLTIFLVAVIFAFHYAVFFWGVGDNIDSGMVDRLLGSMGTLLGIIIAFWFGASRSSQNSETLLYHSTPLQSLTRQGGKKQ
ncbi:MAG: hypothetical protein K2O70_05725 [Desulfovibrionaceae bacterium]|nr:hypothetical protein [Desulfovibrionaceae bacterium]